MPIRFVATYINSDGMRTMVGAMQGRNTHATHEACRQWIDAVYRNNTADVVSRTWGPERLEVRPVDCYDGHFDPKTCYFDEQGS